jgi:hypothetical protein
MDQPESQFAGKVSLVELIVAPAKYDGKTIEVSGYFRAENSVPYLFLTRDDAFMRNSASGIPVNLEHQDAIKCSDKFVKVVGKAEVISTGVVAIKIVYRVYAHTMGPSPYGVETCYYPTKK